MIGTTFTTFTVFKTGFVQRANNEHPEVNYKQAFLYFINLDGVLRHNEEHFTPTTASSLTAGGNRPSGNS